MPFREIGSAQARYLAAADILIGDMSNTNYEFLLYDRPVILLANEWLRKNFPDIGIKADLTGLADAIERSLKNPDEFKKARKYWLEKTIYQPDGLASQRFIDIILSRCQMENPRFVFIHSNNSVRKINLKLLLEEAKRRGLKTEYVAAVPQDSVKDDTVYIGAHYEDLLNLKGGYKVHVGHGLYGKGTPNLEKAIKDHIEHDYMPLTDLYITAGEAHNEYTKTVLGPLHDRRVIGGYPKADALIRLNTRANKISVFKELGFNLNQPLITYAPAGEESYAKPGGSLKPEVIERLREISYETNYNILVKLKYAQPSLSGRLLLKAGSIIARIRG